MRVWIYRKSMGENIQMAYLLLCFLQIVLHTYALDNFYFNSKPENRDVVAGSEILLHCDVSNRNQIEFTWIQSGKDIKFTSRKFQEGRNLRILRVTQEDDSGPFQCIATNETSGFSLLSGEALLNIQWIGKSANVELKRPKPEEVALGKEVILRCQITGNPEPTFLWYHNKFRLFNKNGLKIMDKGSKVRISNVTAVDNGIYSCRAENVAGAVDSTDNFLLNVKAPNTPHLIDNNFVKSVLVLRNQEARLDCLFQNAARVDWFSTHEKISNSSRYTVFLNGSLYFPRVRPSDEGSYRCEGLASDRRIPAQTFTSELVLASLEEFTMDSFEPRLIPNYPIVMPMLEKFVVKVFPPGGKPTPQTSWLDRSDLIIGQSGNIHVEGNNLVFESPQEVDSGNYTIILKNVAGEKRQNVWIIVSVPPSIRRPPVEKEVEEDGKVSFSCQVTGTPYPVTTVIWKKDDEYVKMGSSRHHMDLARGTLEVRNVEMADSGTYSCVANTTGQALVTSPPAYLRVKKKLKFYPYPKNTHIELNHDASITCKAEGDGHVRIKWIKNDQSSTAAPHFTVVSGTLNFFSVQRSDEGLYTCMAYNYKQGSLNATIFIDVVERPKFQVLPKNMTIYENQPVMIHCVATGDPRPNITWDKNNFRDFDFHHSRIKILPNGTLFITKVYMEDKGKYGCTAENIAGRRRLEAYLDVASSTDFIGDKNTKEEGGFDMMKTIIIAVCSAGAYLALVIALTAYCSYRLLLQKRNRKALVKSENGNLSQEQHELLAKDRDSESRTQFRSDSDNRSHISGMSSQPSHSSQSQAHSRSRRGSLDRLQYPRQNLGTLGMLGTGVFGDVFLAKARAIRDIEPETLVVVKSLLTKDEHLFFEFRQEMEMYSKLDHPFIIKLLGVCRETEPQFMISEYCDWGDLKQFLLATRGHINGRPFPTRVPPLTLAQKLNMCNQVASAMEHLSNHRFIHKDLAARNILLTSRLELKISSLSLCRDIYAGEYYQHAQTFIPLRWMSPEAVLEDEYSTKSDVWAFGVVMWEIFQLGELPYSSMSDEEVLKRLKVADLKLTVTDQFQNDIIDVMRKCTCDSPKERPLFSEICISLSDIMTKLQSNTAPISPVPQS